MPLRINLLAEAQAAEELRRKDPVKRAIILGGCCAAVMAVISVAIQARAIGTNRKSADYARRIQSITNEYAGVMKDEDHLHQVNLNMRGLDLLASERLLNGTLLNAIQKVHTENVQMVHLRTEHEYQLTDETRAKTNSNKVLKPATASEKIQVVLEAVDASPNPGDQVNKFKEAIAGSAYIQSLLGTNNEMRLVNLSPPQMRTDMGQMVVQFTLEARLPEKVRLDITSPIRYAPPQAVKTPAPKAARQEPIL